ncbi:hypothetical protein B0H19DRAFT_894469, partial [Mycena capillaripes]
EPPQELDNAVTQIAPKIKVPRVISLPFEVPYKNGTRDLTGITTGTDYYEFLSHAANKMGTHITWMANIGYIPSYKKPRPRPKLLDDEEAWDTLIADVRQFIKASETKNRGKGVV